MYAFVLFLVLNTYSSGLPDVIEMRKAYLSAVNSKESSAFYVVTLFNKGVDGTLRTGLSLNGQNLFYRINDKEIHCGMITFKK